MASPSKRESEIDPLLKKILEAAGVSGYEKEIAKIMQAELTRFCDEVSVDSFGNVIARKGKGKRKIMITAHMDEIGFMAKHITKEGYIQFINAGVLHGKLLYGKAVERLAKQ